MFVINLEASITTAFSRILPSDSGEQPSGVGLFELATRRTTSTRVLPRSRWALTPPFHPYRDGQWLRSDQLSISAVCFLFRLPKVIDNFQLCIMNYALCIVHCPFPPPAVNRCDALCCPDFPLIGQLNLSATNRPAAFITSILKSRNSSVSLMLA